MWALRAGTSSGRFWSSRTPWALLLRRRRRMQARRGPARAPVPEAWNVVVPGTVASAAASPCRHGAALLERQCLRNLGMQSWLAESAKFCETLKCCSSSFKAQTQVAGWKETIIAVLTSPEHTPLRRLYN